VRLASLHPQLVQSPMATSYTHQLLIDCPACGPTYRLIICVVLGEPTGHPGVWGLQLPAVPAGDGWDGVTMSPSHQNNGHGRKKDCAAHFSIINGEVVG
jgi:hypothetical protein